MTTKNDATLRAEMARLLKTPVPVLRKRLAATGRDPAGLSRDELVKTLAAVTETPKDATKPRTAKPQRAPRPSTRKRDERFPAPGGSVSRVYLGKTYTLEVLEAGFRVGDKVFRSPTAAALSIVPYKSVSGPLFWNAATRPAKASRAKPKKGSR